MKVASNYGAGDVFGLHVIHTGMSGKIYNDIFPEGEERYQDLKFPFDATGHSRIVTTGYDSEVYDNDKKILLHH